MEISGCRKRAWATIDLDSAAHNFREIKKRTSAKVCCAVKANAYGHGAVELGALYQELGADFLAVSNIEEALQLRKNNITLPILMLGYTPVECVAELARYNISQAVYSPEYAKKLLEQAEAQELSIKIHVKLDTGMGRIGFKTDTATLDGIVSVCNSKSLIPEGIFTHFAIADGGEGGEEYTKRQYELFQSAIKYLCSRGVDFPIRHCSNSAGIFDYPAFALDMVRAGIVLYGLYPSEDILNKPDLKPVMTLNAVVSHVKEISVGDSISYGRTFIASRPMKVATVPIGYADGIWRSNSNMRYAFKVNGAYAPIVGRVCMDQLMIDVTDIECAIGDEVLIFGSDDACSAEKMAEANSTIGYEIVCAISSRVPRFYIKNGKLVSVKDAIYDADL